MRTPYARERFRYSTRISNVLAHARVKRKIITGGKVKIPVLLIASQTGGSAFITESLPNR